MHFPMLDQLGHYFLSHIDGDGEADANISTARRNNRRIDSDQFTF